MAILGGDGVGEVLLALLGLKIREGAVEVFEPGFRLGRGTICRSEQTAEEALKAIIAAGNLGGQRVPLALQLANLVVDRMPEHPGGTIDQPRERPENAGCRLSDQVIGAGEFRDEGLPRVGQHLDLAGQAAPGAGIGAAHGTPDRVEDRLLRLELAAGIHQPLNEIALRVGEADAGLLQGVQRLFRFVEGCAQQLDVGRQGAAERR